MKKSDTQRPSRTFFLPCLSFMTDAGQTDVENRKSPKNMLSLSKIQILEDIKKGMLFVLSWLSGQYAPETWKITGQMMFQND